MGGRVRNLGCALLVLAVAVGATGCGPFGGGNKDKDQISDVLKKVSLTANPALCTTAFTPNYVRQTFTGPQNRLLPPAKAKALCVKSQTPDNVAKSLDVIKVTVKGEQAVARFKQEPPLNKDGDPQGGNIACMVKQGGTWKLEELAVLDCSKFPFLEKE